MLLSIMCEKFTYPESGTAGFSKTFINSCQITRRHIPDDRNLEICVLLGFYASYIGNSLRTFRDNLSVPSSRVRWTT